MTTLISGGVTGCDDSGTGIRHGTPGAPTGGYGHPVHAQPGTVAAADMVLPAAADSRYLGGRHATKVLERCLNDAVDIIGQIAE